MVLHPGYRRRQNDGRLLRKAVQRGAVTDELLASLELPSNVSFLRAVLHGRQRPAAVAPSRTHAWSGAYPKSTIRPSRPGSPAARRR